MRPPRTRSPPGRADLERELARARGARRMLPWALLTSAGGAALGFAAGGGVRGAAVLLGLGLIFAAFLWVSAIARCPSCGAPLGGERRRAGHAAPGPAGDERAPSCPRCRARFE